MWMTPDLHELHILAGKAAGIEKTCGKKIRYPTEESAARAAASMNAKPTTKRALEEYPCAFCSQWHIGGKMTLGVLVALAETAKDQAKDG
jgi:hypothetical protein